MLLHQRRKTFRELLVKTGNDAPHFKHWFIEKPLYFPGIPIQCITFGHGRNTE